MVPWSVDEADYKLDRRCFIVRDANGQALAYVYFEEEPGRRPTPPASEWVSVHRFQVEYPLEVPSAQLIWVTPTNVPSPLMPSYFPVPPV
jgi:hypothetical protein